ncbi:MAG: tryptophan--tRNA ligase [Nanoarchaeota archaeon]|nr:tryptophan--tRNA ligase [Patescibacteria group bacterium]MBU1988314.1 tryptophan--tRNA ligase [Nanoarchaeota archaeon]
MRVLSGIQPTGAIHIGNYLAAIKQFVALQENNECVYFIADLHALTESYEPKDFQKNILDAAISYLACGLDPKKCILLVQSHVKEHAELAWLLSTVAPAGDLLRMTQYKEKANQFKQNINAGLLNYPILMAADILLYKPDIVPVGQDQKQHIELARTIAKKFNHKFGSTFTVPSGQILKTGAKIMGLDNPKKKMAKSRPQSCLFLFDEPETIQKKIMSAVTDTGKTIKYDPKRKAGISNLLTIYSLFSGESIKALEKKFEGKGYAEFKKSLAKVLIENLEPFRRKRKELLSREIYIKELLNQGAKRAQVIASSTMADVRRKMGLT